MVALPDAAGEPGPLITDGFSQTLDVEEPFVWKDPHVTEPRMKKITGEVSV